LKKNRTNFPEKLQKQVVSEGVRFCGLASKQYDLQMRTGNLGVTMV